MLASQASTLRGLLAILAGAGEIKGRLRLHKEAYLLALKGYPHFKPKRFFYYYSGPHSRDITDALQFAIASNLIQEDSDSFGGKCRYHYHLTLRGKDWLDSESDASDYLVRDLSKVFQTTYWRTLELATSAVFFERSNEAKNREEAFLKALELKPDSKRYSDKAHQLLEALAI